MGGKLRPPSHGHPPPRPPHPPHCHVEGTLPSLALSICIGHKLLGLESSNMDVLPVNATLDWICNVYEVDSAAFFLFSLVHFGWCQNCQSKSSMDQTSAQRLWTAARNELPVKGQSTLCIYLFPAQHDDVPVDKLSSMKEWLPFPGLLWKNMSELQRAHPAPLSGVVKQSSIGAGRR